MSVFMANERIITGDTFPWSTRAKDYSYTIKAVIDHTFIDEDLFNFPVQINLSRFSGKNSFNAEEFINFVDLNSESIVVKDKNTGSILHTEIEYWGTEPTTEVVSSDGSERMYYMASASSNYGSYLPRYAFDGASEDTGRWVSSLSSCNTSTKACSNTWFEIELHDVFEISEIRMCVPYGGYTAGFPKDITIFTSETGNFSGEEVEVCSVIIERPGGEFADSSYDRTWSSWVILPQHAYSKYIRLRVDSMTLGGSQGSNGYIAIGEIEFKGKKVRMPRIFVRVPEVSSTKDTEIYIHGWNKELSNNYTGLVGSETGMSVWDDYFVGVYHTNQDPSLGNGCIKNSKTNNYHGTPYGSISSSYVVDNGKAIYFNGSNQMIHLSNPSITGQGTMEVVTWTSKTFENAIPNWAGPLGVESQSTTKAISLCSKDNDNEIVVFVEDESYQPTLAYTPNKINYLTVTFDSQGLVFNNFSNGGNTSYAFSGLNIDSGLTVARTFGSLYYWPGIIYEVRLSSRKRPQAWLKATYHGIIDNLVSFYRV